MLRVAHGVVTERLNRIEILLVSFLHYDPSLSHGWFHQMSIGLLLTTDIQKNHIGWRSS